MLARYSIQMRSLWFQEITSDEIGNWERSSVGPFVDFGLARRIACRESARKDAGYVKCHVSTFALNQGALGATSASLSSCCRPKTEPT